MPVDSKGSARHARGERSRRHVPAALGAAVIMFAAACSGGNNQKASPSPTAAGVASATVAATRVVASPTGVSGTPSSQSTAPRPSGTPAPPAATPTVDPHFADVVTNLGTVVLHEISDLPAGLRDLQPTSSLPVAITNEGYSQGQQNAAQVTAKLQACKREGGVRQQWIKNQQYTPGLKLTYSVIVDVHQFETPDGAKCGLDFIFSTIQPETKGPNGEVIRATQLAGVPTLGDETRAYRIETTQRTQVPDARGQNQTVDVTYVTEILAWRRGKAIASVTLAAVGQDPALSDLATLATMQDDRLKSAGY